MKLTDQQVVLANEITEKLKSGEKVLFTAGTGAGKSYIACRVRHDVALRKKVLYVVPTYAIREYISRDTPFARVQGVDYVTYNWFLNFEEALSLLELYSLVILDEAHHVVSPIIGTNIQECMSRADCMWLGLTATPLRDDGIDVSKCFDAVVEGPSTFDMIENGTLPPFEYLIASPKLDACSEQQKRNYGIDLSTSTDLLRSMVETANMDKWLVFCSTIEQVREVRDLMHTLLPEHAIWSLTSNQNENHPEEILRSFTQAKQAVLISVNMLLEGLHIDKAGGAIIFSNVQSIVKMQQIIGRVSSTRNEDSPVIIDCTESAYKVFDKIVKMHAVEYVPAPTAESAVSGKRKPLIRRSLVFKQYYDIMDMLRSVKTKTLELRENEVFNSSKDFINQFNTDAENVYKKIRQGVPDSYMYHANSFVVHGRDYESLKKFCKIFETDVTSLLQIRQSHQLSTFEEAAEVYQDINCFKVHGTYYKSVAQAIRHYGLKQSDVKPLMIGCGYTLEGAIEECCGDGLITFGMQGFPNKDALYRYYGISDSQVELLMKNGRLWGEAVSAAISKFASRHRKPYVARQAFEFNGDTYKNFSSFCSAMGIRSGSVSQLMRSRNLTRYEAINLLLLRKEKAASTQ